MTKTVTIVVPEGYDSAEEFAKDCGFEIFDAQNEIPWQVPTITDNKTSDRTGDCEKCGDYGMVALPSQYGWRRLCWSHYCQEVQDHWR